MNFSALPLLSLSAKHQPNLAYTYSAHPLFAKRRRGGLMFCSNVVFLIKKVYFSHFCHINYLNIYWTDLHEVGRIGRTLAVDERSEVIFFDPPRDIATETNFVGKIYLQYSPIVRMTFARARRINGWAADRLCLASSSPYTKLYF